MDCLPDRFQGSKKGAIMSDQRRMFIDGQWVDGYGGRTFAVRDPATGDVIAEVADGGAAEATRAIEAAHRAFPAWAATPARERAPILHRIQALMEARRDELGRLVTRENGKPFEEAKRGVGFALGSFGWLSAAARRTYGDLVPAPFWEKRLWVIHQPVGVVAAITPWTFPATMVTRKFA